MTPQKAIEGCKRQDRISQKYIFDRWSEAMLMLCMRYVQSLPDAEELMLNGFYNFYKTIARFEYSNEQGISAWLKRIMVNESLMHLRKKGALLLAVDQYAADVPADDTSLARMNANEIFKLITTLPAGYRTVFNLYVIEGYSHREIADMLAITEGTSKSQLSKARMLMQKLVKENMLL
jgi:RNA polymerase sigma-70 factor (ECF subfamily)